VAGTGTVTAAGVVTAGIASPATIAGVGTVTAAGFISVATGATVALTGTVTAAGLVAVKLLFPHGRTQAVVVSSVVITAIDGGDATNIGTSGYDGGFSDSTMLPGIDGNSVDSTVGHTTSGRTFAVPRLSGRSKTSVVKHGSTAAHAVRSGKTVALSQ
jgi:hypothetical protein